MNVKLVQLVGQKTIKGETVTVKHPIDRVYVDGVRVGWLAREDHAKFAPTVKLDRGVQRDLVKHLAELRVAEGLYLPTPETGGGVPTPEQFAEAMEQFGEDDDTETEEGNG